MLEMNSETSKDETVVNLNDEKGDENPALSCEEEPSEVQILGTQQNVLLDDLKFEEQEKKGDHVKFFTR